MNCQNKEIVCSAFINLINIEAQVEKQSSKFYDDNHIRNTNFKTKFLATTECQWSLLTNWWCYKKCVCIKTLLSTKLYFSRWCKTNYKQTIRQHGTDLIGARTQRSCAPCDQSRMKTHVLYSHLVFHQWFASWHVLRRGYATPHRQCVHELI